MTANVVPLRILHLEDSEPDHELVLAQLRRGGLAVRGLRVDTRPEFEAALSAPWDAITGRMRPGPSHSGSLRQPSAGFLGSSDHIPRTAEVEAGDSCPPATRKTCWTAWSTPCRRSTACRV